MEENKLNYHSNFDVLEYYNEYEGKYSKLNIVIP